jgi:Flp pilus assembly protein TadD
MDNLDRISIWAIVALIISSFVLASGYKGEAGPDRKLQKRMLSADYSVMNAEVKKKSDLARDLMESGNIEKAEVLVKEMIQKYPYEGEPRMIMGDIFMRRQELLMAMPEYREAVDLNPDYLDKNTDLFQGKKLKVAVNEALAEVEKRVEKTPDDASVRESRKLIYYLKRRIAGSCG